MSHSEMHDLLDKQLLCRITFHDDPYPYTLPMEYYYFGDTMYFHFTTSGRKIDLWKKNPNVTVEVDWHNSDMSDYKSVIIRGTLVSVDNPTERNLVNRAMGDVVKEKVGIKGWFKLPWEKKGVDYLSASNIPLILLKLETKDMTGKKATK